MLDKDNPMLKLFMVRRNKSRKSTVIRAVVNTCRGSKGRKHKDRNNSFSSSLYFLTDFLTLVLNIGKDTLNYLTFNNLEYDSSGFHIWGGQMASVF